MPYSRMAVRESDLTSAARIRNAALEGFAREGVAATSIRDVAEAAGVSAGLVQHHFPTKAALRDAVNEYVLSLAREEFEQLDPDPADAFEEVGDRITEFVRDHPLAFEYVARGVAEGDEAALGIFDTFVGIADAVLGRLADKGLLDPGLDLRWAALNVVVLNLGTVLFRQAVDRHLPEAFASEDGLQRWNRADTALFKGGFYRR